MQVIFFALSLSGLLIGHAAFYYLFINFFNVTIFWERLIVATVIAVLFFNIVLASFLVHRRDNVLTRAYYIFSGVWIGFFINLCLMSVLVVILKFGGQFFNLVVPTTYLKIIFWSGGILLSIWGIYRALVPKVTTYEIVIKGLPASWHNRVVVQLSDVHLGPVYRKKFFYRLIDKINSLKPEAVFITGDLFDGMEADFSWMNHPFKKLKAPRGIYYSFGNHDLYLGFNKTVSLLSGNPVKILDNKLVNISGLQVIGINYSFDSSFNLEKAILRQVGYKPERPSILLFHEPKNISLAKKVDINLQLSGHTHDGQLWPFNYIVKWAHKNFSYGLFQDGNFSLVISSGAGTWGPPMRTAARAEIVKIILKKK